MCHSTCASHEHKLREPHLEFGKVPSTWLQYKQRCTDGLKLVFIGINLGLTCDSTQEMMSAEGSLGSRGWGLPTNVRSVHWVA